MFKKWGDVIHIANRDSIREIISRADSSVCNYVNLYFTRTKGEVAIPHLDSFRAAFDLFWASRATVFLFGARRFRSRGATSFVTTLFLVFFAMVSIKMKNIQFRITRMVV